MTDDGSGNLIEISEAQTARKRRVKEKSPAPVSDGRHDIKWSTSISSVTDAIHDALVGRPEAEIFQRAGRLVSISITGAGDDGRVRRAVGAPVIREASAAWLRDRADRYCRILKLDGRSEALRVVPMPDRELAGLLARGEWRFPVLEGTTQTPIVRTDGTVCSEPGYDQGSGWYYSPAHSFPPIPERPSLEDAVHAAGQLLEGLAEMPWVDATDRAAALALILTIAGRTAIAGPTPMFVVDAVVRGTGKGKLVTYACFAGSGAKPGESPQSEDTEETRKALMAALMAGDRVVLIDNLDHPLGGGGLEVAVTAWPNYADRILGRSEKPSVPNRTVFVATGNNVTYKGDMARRVVPIRLDPNCENPEERRFAIEDLAGWAEEHAPRLVVASLTILKAHALAGRPRVGLGPVMGAFEAWDRTIRAVVVWLGLGDPLGGQAALRRRDTTRDTLDAMLSAWVGEFGSGWRRAGDVVAYVNARSDGDPMFDATQEVKGRAPQLTSQGLGRWLVKHEKRLVNGRRFESREDPHTKRHEWRVTGDVEQD